jgi:hypothetical protein
MVYAYTQDVPITEEMYSRITQEIGSDPIDGLLLHLCVRRENGSLYYIEVWESEEANARAFEQRIHPAVDRAFGGRRPASEPTVQRLDVVDTIGPILGKATA